MPYDLTLENLNNDFGQWWSNNDALGEVLLSQLRGQGVDTKAATEAALREVLNGLVEDTNRLQGLLANFANQSAQITENIGRVANAMEMSAAMTGQPMDYGMQQPMEQMPPELMAQQGGMSPEAPQPEQAPPEQMPPEEMSPERQLLRRLPQKP